MKLTTTVATIEMLKDEDATVRRYAVGAIAEIGDGRGEGLDFLRRKPVNPLFIIFFRKAFIVFIVPARRYTVRATCTAGG